MYRLDEIKISGESECFKGAGVPEIAVLLPTFKRAEILGKILEAIEAQTLPSDTFEVIIVDDGSQDETEAFLNRYCQKSSLRVTYSVLKENGGPARARNFGLSMCRAKVILIIGDDIEPDPDLVEKHLVYHQENSEESAALLGYVYFPPELKPNGFMRWLEHEGRKYFFDYDGIQSGQKVDHLFFYTCNVSVKDELLKKSGWFDESFPFASHEDLELGYRLSQEGMSLVYDPTAKGAHWHMLTVQGIGRRVYLMGYSANIFWQRVGGSGGVLKRTSRNIISWVASTAPCVSIWQRLLKKDYADDKKYTLHWHSLLFLSFFIGLQDSRNNRSVRL